MNASHPPFYSLRKPVYSGQNVLRSELKPNFQTTLVARRVESQTSPSLLVEAQNQFGLRRRSPEENLLSVRGGERGAASELGSSLGVPPTRSDGGTDGGDGSALEVHFGQSHFEHDLCGKPGGRRVDSYPAGPSRWPYADRLGGKRGVFDGLIDFTRLGFGFGDGVHPVDARPSSRAGLRRSDPVNQRLTKPPDIASITDNLDGQRDPSNRKSNRDFDRGGGADRSAEGGVVTALPADRGISNSVLHSIEATFIDAGMRGENEVIASDSSDTSSQYSYSESLYDLLASMDEDRSFTLGGGHAAERNAVGLELQ